MSVTDRKRANVQFEEDNYIKLVAQNSTGTLSDQYDDDEREGENPAIRWLTKLDWNSEEDNGIKLVAQNSTGTLSDQYDNDGEGESPAIRWLRTLDDNSEEDNDVKLVAQNSRGTLSDQYDNDEREGENPAIRWLRTLDGNSEEDNDIKLVKPNSTGTLSDQYDNDERVGENPAIRSLRALDGNSEEGNDIKLVAQNSTGTLSDPYNDDEREGESPAIRWLTTLLDWNLCVKRSRREVKKRIRHGLTNSTRSLVWQVISGGRYLLLANPGVYSLLLSNETPKNLKFENLIVQDLHRTLQSEGLFQTKGGAGQRCLHNVLKAYSVYDIDLGYTQGMNFIAAMPLLYMNEEQAFWVMAGLLKGGGNKRIRGVYLEGLPLLHQYFFQFEILVKEQLPKLARHFMEQGIMPAMYASSWFVTAFSANLPLRLVVRIWDIFLYEGVKIIFRVGLALLKLFEDDLLKLHFEYLLQFLSRFPNETVAAFDANTLVTMACSFKLKKRLQELELAYEEKNDKLRVTSRPINK